MNNALHVRLRMPGSYFVILITFSFSVCQLMHYNNTRKADNAKEIAPLWSLALLDFLCFHIFHTFKCL